MPTGLATDFSAVRPRPRFVDLVIAAAPISQHLGVIALFIAVFHGMLVRDLHAGQVGWTCVVCSLVAYFLRRYGWGMDHGGSEQKSGMSKTKHSTYILKADLALAIILQYKLSPRPHIASIDPSSTADITPATAVPLVPRPRHLDQRNYIRQYLAAGGRAVLRSLAPSELHNRTGCESTALAHDT